MITLLQNLVTTVTAIVMYVIHAIQSLINLVLKLPTYIAFITTSINLLPAVVIPFCMAAVTIYYVLFIIDR